MKTIEKYPKRFTYLPHDFEKHNSHNKTLKTIGINNFKLIDNVFVVPKEYLGLNKPNPTIQKTIEFGEIYILNAIGTSLYKIGHSGNFKRRYRDIVNASPIPIRVVKYAKCDNPNMLENYIHDNLKGKYFKNEWFSLDKKDLDKIDSIFNRYFHAN